MHRTFPHEPTCGQNHLTQRLFYSKMLTISCNLLTTVLKVKIRMVVWVQMVVSVSIVDPHGHEADWELPHYPASQERVSDHILLAREKTQMQISKYAFY